METFLTTSFGPPISFARLCPFDSPSLGCQTFICILTFVVVEDVFFLVVFLDVLRAVVRNRACNIVLGVSFTSNSAAVIYDTIRALFAY